MIILHEGSYGVVVTSIGETARPADMIHHPAVLAEDGEDIITAAWDETVTPAETQAEFAARMVAAHVPDGARHVIADPATLPTDAPPERWSVDWATGAVTVLPVPPPTADAIRAECTRRVTAAIGGKRGSINSYGIALNGKVSLGMLAGQPPQAALTAEEFADVQLLWAIDAWEGQMVATRETAILAPSQAIYDDATWPPQPAGLTPQWLAGF